MFPQATDAFVDLVENPFQTLDVNSENFKTLERLNVILFDKTSHLSSVNDSRKVLICHGNLAMDKLQPKTNSLLQHLQRVVYHTGIWANSTQSRRNFFTAAIRLDKN